MGRTLKQLSLVWLLICVGSFLSSSHPVVAQTNAPLTVSYIGLDNVHIGYNYSTTCVNCQVKLEVLQDNTVIHSVTLNHREGTYHHRNLGDGEYTYRIVEYLGDELENIIAYRTAVIDGLIGGTLLFNESINGTFACKQQHLMLSVIIPKHKSLSIFNSDNEGACHIVVDGTFRLRETQWGGSSLDLIGSGTALLSGIEFSQGVGMFVGPDVSVTVTNSIFRRSLRLEGSSQNLRFDGNYFLDNVSLRDRMPVIFDRNYFLGALDLHTMSGTQTWCGHGHLPSVRNNSFLGQMALTATGYQACSSQSLFNIGPNYYGDYSGPRYILPADRQPLPNVEYRTKWLQRGAGVLAPPFNASNMTFQQTGLGLNDTRIAPKFWLNNFRLGQHVIGTGTPSIIRGKESLYTIDLVTTHNELHGAKVWVIWNGERVEATSGLQPPLRRDHGERAFLYRYARTSIDFILPPVDSGDSATLELWLDSREIEGHSGGELRKLQELSVVLRAPPGPIGIHLVPVTVNGVTPSLRRTRTSIAGLMPAIFPVTSDNVQISSTSYSPSFSDRYVPTSFFLNVIANDLLRYKLALQYDPVDYPRGELMDFVIGVMPAGSLAGADGVYMNLRRGVIMVDAGQPDAFFHEMGHAIGLYRLREQYNWPFYPPSGRPVEGYTLFLNHATVASSQVLTLFPTANGRVHHAPQDFQWWHDPSGQVVDVMGNQRRFWPHPSTLQSFEDYFYQLGSTRPLPSASTQMLQASDELRRVLLTMETERVERVEGTLEGERRCVTYRPIPETLRLFAREGARVGVDRPAVEPEVVGDAALPLCLKDVRSPFFHPAGDIQLCLMPIGPDDDIMPEYQQCQRVLAPDLVHTSRQRDLAFFSFDVPRDAVAYSLVSQRGQLPAVVIQASATLDLQLLAPQTGATLSDTVTLRWQGTQTPRDPERPSGQPLLYQIAVSSDNGATWQEVGLPVEGDQVTLSTEALPAGEAIALRVSASDGFQFAHAQVTGLRLAPRRPEVEILSPQPGDYASPDQPWMLRAWGWDVEANAPLIGTWHSSLDGSLGSGSLLTGVRLSAGRHQLSYRVTDGRGVEASAAIEVRVAATPGRNLALAADALHLTMPWRDPVVVGPPQLRVGSPQTATLTLRNPGVAMTATLRLALQPPTGAERQLASTTFWFEPFETYIFSVPMSATQVGAYRLRGEVVAHTATGAVASTHERNWSIEALSAPALTPNATSIQFSAPPGDPVYRTLTLRNTGGQSLIVEQVTLRQTEQNPQPFQIWVDNCSNLGLTPTESCQVTIQFIAATGVDATAEIEVTATDPGQQHTIALNGAVGTHSDTLYLPLVVR